MKELVSIQKKLKAPKGQYNSFGRYNYRSAEDILEAVKPLCSEEGCILTLSDDIALIGDRYYIVATATITKGEQSVSTKAFAREPDTKKGMDSSQITGTASSYARKYALNGLFCIDDTQDADTDAYHEVTHKEKAKDNTNNKPITDNQLKMLKDVVKTEEQKSWVKSKTGVEKLEDLTMIQASKLIKIINSKK